MKFRAPSDEPVHLRLLTGHTATLTREWKELDEIFHAAAFEKRCECDKGGIIAPKDVAIQAADQSDGKFADADAHYRAALTTMLERNEEGDFTQDGLPNLKALSKVIGFTAVREELLVPIRDAEIRDLKRHTRVHGIQDAAVEDQVTFPLTTELQGLAGVRVVRSQSAFGFSMVYVVFDDGVDLYFARTRVLERMNLITRRLPTGDTQVLSVSRLSITRTETFCPVLEILILNRE